MDYKLENITGKRWQRTHTINIVNRLGGVPTATFLEEQAVRVGETETVVAQLRQAPLAERMTNPNESFNLLDQDGKVIGTMTYMQVYGVLASLYFHVANKRDNPVVTPATPEA